MLPGLRCGKGMCYFVCDPLMPELPEVETVARGLRRTIVGRRILSVRLGKTDFIQTKLVAMTLDLERFEQTPLNKEPFEYLVVPEFVKSQAREGISDDYPKVDKAGSFPLSEVNFGPKFKELTDDLNGPEFRAAVERKFSIDLEHRPTMITVRGRCSEKDGKIHTDSKTKIITVLLYLNSK